MGTSGCTEKCLYPIYVFIYFIFLPIRFSLFYWALEKLIEVLIQDKFETLYYILSGFNLTFEVGAI